jgi:hypothetical protein
MVKTTFVCASFLEENLKSHIYIYQMFHIFFQPQNVANHCLPMCNHFFLCCHGGCASCLEQSFLRQKNIVDNSRYISVKRNSFTISTWYLPVTIMH